MMFEAARSFVVDHVQQVIDLSPFPSVVENQYLLHLIRFVLTIVSHSGVYLQTKSVKKADAFREDIRVTRRGEHPFLNG
jgi:hypothetical protein